MNRKYFVISVIILVILITYFIYSSLTDKKTINETIINDISKSEYIFKDELLKIGYSIDEIKKIEDKVNLNDVKNYLLDIKINDLVSFLSSPYFNIKHLNRYEDYYKNNKNLSIDEIIMNVEIGLDHDYYTNVEEVKDYTSNKALVNKYNKLKDNIEFDDLVKIEKPYSNDEDKLIRKEAYVHLKELIDDASKDNINLFVVSAYRTKEYQTTLFNNSVKNNGETHALMYSAKPLHSEHELGLAVDFNNTDLSFDNTKESNWLKENAYKYGFILRYPKGKENITGFSYEPWHYRYIGVDDAIKIFENNITLEEYIIKY